MINRQTHLDIRVRSRRIIRRIVPVARPRANREIDSHGSGFIATDSRDREHLGMMRGGKAG
jgi:hypothetical protein